MKTRSNKNRSTKKPQSPKKSWIRRIWPWIWKAGLVVTVTFFIGLVYLDSIVREKFEGKRWAIPAKVYARPLELYIGAPIRAADLEQELNQLGYQFSLGLEKPGTINKQGNQLSIRTRPFQFWDGNEPDQVIEIGFDQQSITSLKVDSQIRDLVRLEPIVIGGIYPAHNEDRVLIQLTEAPDLLKRGLVAVEDKDFYQHYGISVKGITRAFVANVRAGRVVQGGSTLTQQLVKNFFLDGSQTITRKAVEALMAMLLEFHYRKSEILEAYLNEVNVGRSGRREIHGFGLAARHYFSKDITNLQTHEIALLIGIVNGPSFYNPHRNPERSLKRRNLVLEVMFNAGLIDQIEMQHALNRPLDLAPRGRYQGVEYPAYLDLVRRQLRREYREQDLTSEGLKIFTAFDPSVQRAAEEALTKRLARLEPAYGMEKNSLEGAVIVTSTEGGEIQALVGSRNPRYFGFNRALDGLRQIGSLMKPAVYLSALEQSERYHLASQIDDSEVTVSGQDGSLWQPENFDNESHGIIPLYKGLAKSYNQATARLGMKVGLSKVVDTAHRLGITRHINPYPSMLLGATALSPLEVASIYQTIASGGFQTPLRAIRGVTTANGDLLTSYGLQVKQSFDSRHIQLIQTGLQQVVEQGTSIYAKNQLGSDLKLAGKTGTSNDLRDSWFAGYSGNHLAVVWVGNDNNKPTKLTGSSGALRVWTQMMKKLSLTPVQDVPALGLEYHWVDENGLLSAESCVGALQLPFIEGTAPVEESPCRKPADKKKKSWLESLFD